MLQNNFLATLITLILALLWLRANDFAAQRGWITSRTSRKIIHIGTGPLFVVCWLLFNPAPTARYLAALVPLGITAQFLLVGLGIVRDEAAVQAMSRSGDRREILHGPLYYGIVFVAVTVFYWKDSPIGIVALMLMCGGDGLADLVGYRFGTRPLPWNPEKSWAGSLGMLLGGGITAWVVIIIYTQFGVLSQPASSYLLPVTVITLLGTVVESLPIRNIDNLTVTVAAIAAGMFFW